MREKKRRRNFLSSSSNVLSLFKPFCRHSMRQTMSINFLLRYVLNCLRENLFLSRKYGEWDIVCSYHLSIKWPFLAVSTWIQTDKSSYRNTDTFIILILAVAKQSSCSKFSISISNIYNTEIAEQCSFAMQCCLEIEKTKTKFRQKINRIKKKNKTQNKYALKCVEMCHWSDRNILIELENKCIFQHICTSLTWACWIRSYIASNRPSTSSEAECCCWSCSSACR